MVCFKKTSLPKYTLRYLEELYWIFISYYFYFNLPITRNSLDLMELKNVSFGIIKDLITCPLIKKKQK